MGYVDQQIAAYQKALGEAISGKRLRDSIRQLQKKAEVRDSLQDLPARGAITAKRKIGKPIALTGTTYNEVTRLFHTTLRELRSSDGLFVLEYYNVRQMIYDKRTDNLLDHDPDA